MTNPTFADLHIHTNHSDGDYSPRDVVKMAYDKGLKSIAITDHDNTSGVAEASEYAKKTDVRVIPGIEMSTKMDNRSLHIIGLFIDIEDQNIRDYSLSQKQIRREWALKSVARIQELGYDLSIEEVENHSSSGMLGKNHIAKALVSKGICKNTETAFSDFLVKGSKAYISKTKIESSEAIQLIKNAGGLAILAHPGDNKIKTQIEAAEIENLMKLGLDGIEAYSKHHSPEQIDYYLKVARDRNLLISGGSDFHGDNNGKIGCPGLSEEDHGLLISHESS